MFGARPFCVTLLCPTISSREVVAPGYRLRDAASQAAISRDCSKRPGRKSVTMVTSGRWTS
jgi:hypothetical protein